ncbi:ABC transporter family protein [Hydrogenophaga sp. RAC07]|uniref:ATP-binding cassette domain-containing protein n=1 Tax=Hydrogenophaga sp. RAC07 TaxID=1842537 RepID=UPI00083CAD85|nr:ABC transporter ATP-binding protein [Hydrogenophaga sp. RAC07]AOF84537.1 ABC transporter family protein [Hydrogenophaga sp. RAC07]
MAEKIRPAWKLARQISGYLGFVARRFRTFYLVLALTFLVLMLEYVATSLMIPMAPGQAAATSTVTALWTKAALWMGLEPVTRTWLWLFFVVMMGRLLLGYLLSVLTTWLGKQVHETLSGKVFSHLLLLEPMGRVYTRSVGHYITMAGDDTFKSGTIITSLLQSAVGFFTAVVGMIVLYQFSPPAFAGVVAFLALSLLAVGLLMRHVLRVNAFAVQLSRELGTTFVEALNSLRSIRSLHGERFVIAAYAAQIHAYIRMLVQLDAVKTGVKTFPPIVLLLAAVVVLRPGTQVDMSDAALFAGTLIVIRVFASLGQMVTAGSQLLTDIRAVKDIGTLVEMAQETQSLPPVPTGTRVHSLDLHDVTFGYGDRGRVLDHVNFRFEASHTYAIIGPSGAGKSTLADILLGLSTPDSGRIQVNADQIPLGVARARFMLVEQQPKIFSSTVRENLLLGADASEEVLHAALDTVNLRDMVDKLEHGLDTRLSYLGENFSGGQRQRLGIARALVRQPDLLILDEATSALDPATRVEVVAKLRSRMRDGIIIFITHDPEIAALADQVLTIGLPVRSEAQLTPPAA